MNRFNFRSWCDEHGRNYDESNTASNPQASGPPTLIAECELGYKQTVKFRDVDGSKERYLRVRDKDNRGNFDLMNDDVRLREDGSLQVEESQTRGGTTHTFFTRQQ